MATLDSTSPHRFLQQFTDTLTPELAQHFVSLPPNPDLQTRLDELGKKANDGTLTLTERSEYDTYVEAMDVIALLRVRAIGPLLTFPSWSNLGRLTAPQSSLPRRGGGIANCLNRQTAAASADLQSAVTAHPRAMDALVVRGALHAATRLPSICAWKPESFATGAVGNSGIIFRSVMCERTNER